MPVSDKTPKARSSADASARHGDSFAAPSLVPTAHAGQEDAVAAPGERGAETDAAAPDTATGDGSFASTLNRFSLFPGGSVFPGGASPSPTSPVRPQAKMSVSQPGEPAEVEAENMADQVMRMPAPASTQAVSRTGAATPSLSRRHAPEAGADAADHLGVQGDVDRDGADAAPAVNRALAAGGGQSLDGGAQQFLSARMGYDFTKVRIHADENAARSADAVNAQAYTVGNNVVFGRGQYQPGTSAGRKLLAHELTHVVQQTGGSPTSSADTGEAENAAQQSEGAVGNIAARSGAAPSVARQVATRGQTSPRGQTSSGPQSPRGTGRAAAPDEPYRTTTEVFQRGETWAAWLERAARRFVRREFRAYPEAVQTRLIRSITEAGLVNPGREPTQNIRIRLYIPESHFRSLRQQADTLRDAPATAETQPQGGTSDASGQAQTDQTGQREPGSQQSRATDTPPGTPPVPEPTGGGRVGFARINRNLPGMLYPEAGGGGRGESIPFGTRLLVLNEENGWCQVAADGKVGWVNALMVHYPPPELLAKDPGVRLYRVPDGATGFGLVQEVYHLAPEQLQVGQDLRFYLNVIRSVNKPEAFRVREGSLLDGIVDGRDARNVELIGGMDIWIPSLQYAATADVGSGSLRGETSRFLRRQVQRVEDFKAAVAQALPLVPGAIASHVTQDVLAMLEGLPRFALEAAGILAGSTIVGAAIGFFAGGVGAGPGAALGFEIGLQILELYGLGMLAAFLIQKGGAIFSSLGQFVALAWQANGNPNQIQAAAQACADAMGNFVALILEAILAWAIAKGGSAAANRIGSTRFGQIVGKSATARWLSERVANQTNRRNRAIQTGRERAGEASPTIRQMDEALQARQQRRQQAAQDRRRTQSQSQRDMDDALNDRATRSHIEDTDFPARSNQASSTQGNPPQQGVSTTFQVPDPAKPGKNKPFFIAATEKVFLEEIPAGAPNHIPSLGFPIQRIKVRDGATGASRGTINPDGGIPINPLFEFELIGPSGQSVRWVPGGAPPPGFRFRLRPGEVTANGFAGGHTREAWDATMAQYGDKIAVTSQRQISFRVPGETRPLVLEQIRYSFEGQAVQQPKTIFNSAADLAPFERHLSEALNRTLTPAEIRRAQAAGQNLFSVDVPVQGRGGATTLKVEVRLDPTAYPAVRIRTWYATEANFSNIRLFPR